MLEMLLIMTGTPRQSRWSPPPWSGERGSATDAAREASSH